MISRNIFHDKKICKCHQQICNSITIYNRSKNHFSHDIKIYIIVAKGKKSIFLVGIPIYKKVCFHLPGAIMEHFLEGIAPLRVKTLVN